MAIDWNSIRAGMVGGEGGGGEAPSVSSNIDWASIRSHLSLPPQPEEQVPEVPSRLPFRARYETPRDIIGTITDRPTLPGPYREYAPERPELAPEEPRVEERFLDRYPTPMSYLRERAEPATDFGMRTLTSAMETFAEGATGLTSLPRTMPRRLIQAVGEAPDVYAPGLPEDRETLEEVPWVAEMLKNYESSFDAARERKLPALEPDVTLADVIPAGLGFGAGIVPGFTSLISKSQEELGEDFEPDYFKDEEFLQEYEQKTITERLKENPRETFEIYAPNVLGSGLGMIASNILTGGTGTGAVFMGAATGEDIKNMAIQNGVEPQKAETIGIATAIPVMLLERVGFDTILGKGALKNVGTSFGGRILKSALSEAGTEALQEEVQIEMERTFKDVTGSDARARIGMAALGGAFGGVVFGSSASAFNTAAGKYEAKADARAKTRLADVIEVYPQPRRIEQGLDYKPTENAVLQQKFVDQMVKDVRQQTDLIDDVDQKERAQKAIDTLADREYTTMRDFEVELSRVLPEDLDIRMEQTTIGQEFNKALAATEEDTRQYIVENAFEEKVDGDRRALTPDEIDVIVGVEAAPLQNILQDVVDRVEKEVENVKDDAGPNPDRSTVEAVVDAQRFVDEIEALQEVAAPEVEVAEEVAVVSPLAVEARKYDSSEAFAAQPIQYFVSDKPLSEISDQGLLSDDAPAQVTVINNYEAAEAEDGNVIAVIPKQEAVAVPTPLPDPDAALFNAEDLVVLGEGQRDAIELSDAYKEGVRDILAPDEPTQYAGEVVDDKTRRLILEEEVTEKPSRIKTEKEIVANRRNRVRTLQERYGLSDTDMKKVSGKDVRLMKNFEFKKYIDAAEQRAVELADTRQKKNELMTVIRNKDFRKLENYRRAAGLPAIKDMTPDQMQDYMQTLEQFEQGDEFLPKRTLEVIDRTNLEGVKTVREARKRLAEEFSKTLGREVTEDDLTNINVSALDALRFDTALAEKSPFYGFIVEKTHEHILEGEATFLEVQDKVQELAKASNKSRKRGVTERLIPQNKEIVEYLEADPEEKQAYADELTEEELDYANYIEKYYSNAYEHLLSQKELYGSRFADQYFTHVRKTFLEKWKDDSLISAVRDVWQSHKEDQVIANIIDQDTGNILPKSKFFQYTIQRSGNIEPSQNVTRVFLQYARMFERKRMLDQLIPEVTTYTQILEPKDLTKNGLEMDRRLKTFVNKYLNNKKGRKETFGGIIKQNGPADMALRAGNTLVSLMDLGFNVGASTAASVGEQVMTYQALGKIKYAKAWKRRLWDTGLKRLKNKNAKKILKQAEPFIGRNIWTELAEVDKGIGERFMQGMFGAFSQSSVEANKIFLLGNLTKEELQAGKVSPQRMARLKLEAGRWRDMGKDVQSVVGSTSIGAATTKYKGWAIPIARTTIKDLTDLGNKLQARDFKGAVTGREIQELYRAIEMSAILLVVGSAIRGEEDDDSFLGKLKARIYQESMTFLGGIDPTLFLSTPRLFSFTQKLASNLKTLVALEEYEKDTKWGREGELKGLRGIQRQFTPAVIRQFGQPQTVAQEIAAQLKRATTPEEREAILKEYTDEGLYDENTAKNIKRIMEDELAEQIVNELNATDDKFEQGQILSNYEQQGKLTSGVIKEIQNIKTEQSMTRQEKKLLDKGPESRAKEIIKELEDMDAAQRGSYLSNLEAKGVVDDEVLNEIIRQKTTR